MAKFLLTDRGDRIHEVLAMRTALSKMNEDPRRREEGTIVHGLDVPKILRPPKIVGYGSHSIYFLEAMKSPAH